MTLLADLPALRHRRDIAAGALAPLAESLARDLQPLLGREPFVPPEKARLSRMGGRCVRDGALLEFDPFEPRRHRCPLCATVYEGEAHYRFWIHWYQLWLAERAVHGALLGTLGGGEPMLRLARDILEAYAERYLAYPDRDNVLGPTRLFFSTYLESIWLLQICVAADLLALAGHEGTRARVLDRIVEPSSTIIAGYDEGASNRQVWNNAALLAAYRLLGRQADAERVVMGGSGLLAHLRDGLLEDGTWYEGENYHLFAHRGLWYGVAMAEHAALALPRDLVRRFDEGFAAPFLTALPDHTLPSRRDSQYRISLRQWRFAELAELGLARRDDARLAGALQRLYEDDVPRRETGRATSSAEAERNLPSSSLSRADLGWRSLLFARAVLPQLEPCPAASVLLPAQGLAVLRREGARIWVALDYGSSGGGHGHPDRLDLLLADGDVRWLDDMGTGSYVDPSLHWYRSTLAHSAPLVDGRSQERVDGTLVAYDERGAAGWCAARASIADGVTVERAIVVMDEYLVDTLTWSAGHDVTLDLPLRVDAALETAPPEPAPLEGSDGLEDGFRFLRDCARVRAPAGSVVRLGASRGESSLRGWVVADADAEWWHARAPGAPGETETRGFWIVRQRGRSGRLRSVLAWRDAVAGVAPLTATPAHAEAIEVTIGDGSRHLHSRTPQGWRVELHAGGARSSIDLGGLVLPGPPPAEGGTPPAPIPAAIPVQALSSGRPLVFQLGEPHYRRSEESWEEAGRPAARVTLSRHGSDLRVHVAVARSDRTFVPAGAVNPYDNEHPDINGDGVQLYVATRGGLSAWVLVPEPDGRVRARVVDGWTSPRELDASWTPEGEGYALTAVVGLRDAGDVLALDVIVNEMPAGRERRRGQLVLSGRRGGEEFVYLRGDRHDPGRLLLFHLVNG